MARHVEVRAKASLHISQASRMSRMRSRGPFPERKSEAIDTYTFQRGEDSGKEVELCRVPSEWWNMRHNASCEDEELKFSLLLRELRLSLKYTARQRDIERFDWSKGA
jgi:hypothetical protein